MDPRLDRYFTAHREQQPAELEVNGMWGGFQGAGSKTVIICETHAKITCRLIADQHPEEIQQLVKNHLLQPTDQPALVTAGNVLSEVMGQKAVLRPMSSTTHLTSSSAWSALMPG